MSAEIQSIKILNTLATCTTLHLSKVETPTMEVSAGTETFIRYS